MRDTTPSVHGFKGRTSVSGNSLPKGEGRGEGEQDVSKPDAPDAFNASWREIPLQTLSLTLIVALLATGCSKQSTRPDLLAKVGPVEIRVEDFNKELERRAKANQPVPNAETLLEEMISRELLLLKASQSGLNNDPEVRRAIQSVLITKLKEREMKPRIDHVEVTAAEVRARYEQHLPQYTTPAKAHLAMLHLQIDPKMNEPDRTELRARLETALALATRAVTIGGWRQPAIRPGGRRSTAPDLAPWRSPARTTRPAVTKAATSAGSIRAGKPTAGLRK